MVKQWYGRRMGRWENNLAFRSTNRVVRSFDWGVEWTSNWPAALKRPRVNDEPEAYIAEMNAAALLQSEAFFGYTSPTDFRLEEHWLKFTSPVDTPYPENNTVNARLFRARQSPNKAKKAVVVLPHWNASLNQHMALCAGIAKLGITALRLSLPYHDHRMPPELERADYAVSSNIARTIDATRQAVIDTRATFDWLQQQGL